MMNFSYDDIYGISLDEYCKWHDLTLDDLIKKVEIDIDILKASLMATLEKKLPYPESYLETMIYKTISKKEKHLQHLLDWKVSGSSKETLE